MIQGPWSPKLARLRDEPERFRASFSVMQRFAYSVAGAILLLIGPGTIWIVTLYGEDYAAAGPIVSVLAFRTAVKMGSTGLRCTMLSLGHSTYVMIMNLGGLVAPIGTAYVIIKGGSLVEIAYWMVIAELVSFVLGGFLVKHCMKHLKLVDIWVAPILILVTAGAVLAFEMWLIDGMNNYLAIVVTIAITGASLGGAMLAFPQIRPSRVKGR